MTLHHRRALRLLPLTAAVFAFPQVVSAADAAVTDAPAEVAADAAAVTATATAAADPNGSVALGTVTVRANPLGKTSDQLVQPTTVLSGEKLDRQRRGTIGETLENTPGISTSDFGSGAGRPIIRGQAGPRVDILENGVGSLDVSDVSPDHAVAVDTAHARQIEVLKGPATLLYGSRASGGIVNVIDDRLPIDVTEGLHGSIEGQYGSNADERLGNLELGYGIGHSQFHIDASGRKAEQFDIPGNARVDGTGSQGFLANSRVQSDSGALSYGYISGANSVSFAVSEFNTVYGLPAEENAFINADQTRYDGQAILNRPLPFLESVKIRGAYNSYTHTEFEDAVTPGTVFFNKQNDERIEAVHVPVFGWRGVFGVQHDFRRFSAVGEESFVPPTHTLQLGAFLVEEHPYKFGKLELGARVERDTNKPEGNGIPDRNYTPVSVSAGSIFNLDAAKAYHLKLYFSRSQRSPVPEELYSFGPHGATATFERGNGNAKLETANNFEIGFDHHDQRWSWELNGYYNRIQNYLFLQETDSGLNADRSGTANSDGVADRVTAEGQLDPEGEFLLVDYRQSNVKFYGFEAQTDYALVTTGPYKVNVHAFADKVVGQVDGGGDLPRVTPMRFGGSVEGKYQRYHATLTYTRVERQGNIAPLETVTGGYNQLGIDLGYRFRLTEDAEQDSELFLRGRNLLNEDERRHTSFIKDVAPLPGTSIFVGFRLAI